MKLLKKVEIYVRKILEDNLSEKYCYHNILHTEEVINFCKKISKETNLSKKEEEILILSAWFHDTGFTKTYKGHEEESQKIAQEFLTKENVDSFVVKSVLTCIESTKVPQNPETEISKILCDADLFHFGSDNFLERSKFLRKEWDNILNIKLSKREYFINTYDFMESHYFHTEFGKTILKKKKEENFLKLKNWISKNKKINKEIVPNRGIETMFRNLGRNQVHLSAIADNKANIMISVNAIIISVILTFFANKIEENYYLIIPTVMMVITNLTTIVFAVLATRPEVKSEKFTKKDVLNKKVNLLFFGNFYKMELDTYLFGMKEMMKDYNYLYDTLIKDQFFLGKVLRKKYKLLRITYNIFMYGLIISVLIFSIFLFF